MALAGVKRRARRRAKRREKRNERKMADLEAQAERQAFRDAHGIEGGDRRPVMEGLDSLGGAVGNAVGGLFGGRAGEAVQNNVPMIAALALGGVGLFLLTKKK